MTTDRTWLGFLPLMVTVVPGGPLAGEKLVTSRARSPVQNRGSAAGTKRVATTLPDCSTRAFKHGATIEGLHFFRKMPVVAVELAA
jgi:hypothetical protein